MTTNRSSEELQMREIIVPELRRRWPAARVIHELPLRYSTNRIDLAAVTETEIVSVEIKSSRDVVDRLEAQLRAFMPISSHMIVALAPKWNEKLPMLEVPNKRYRSYRMQYTEAQEVIERVNASIFNSGIEVWTVDAAAGTIDVTRPGSCRANRPWLAQMLHMLHVAELAHIACEHQIAVPKRVTHLTILNDLIDLLQGREVVRAVCNALRSRNAFVNGTDAPIQSQGRSIVLPMPATQELML